MHGDVKSGHNFNCVVIPDERSPNLCQHSDNNDLNSTAPPLLSLQGVNEAPQLLAPFVVAEVPVHTRITNDSNARPVSVSPFARGLSY